MLVLAMEFSKGAYRHSERRMANTRGRTSQTLLDRHARRKQGVAPSKRNSEVRIPRSPEEQDRAGPPPKRKRAGHGDCRVHEKHD